MNTLRELNSSGLNVWPWRMCYSVGGTFSGMVWVHSSPSREVSNHEKVVLSDCPHPVMRHFCPDGRGSNHGWRFPLFIWHEGSEVWRVWTWCLYATTFTVATSRRHFCCLFSFNLSTICICVSEHHPTVIPTHPSQSGCTTRSTSSERRRSGPAGSADTCPPPAARSNLPECWTGRTPQLTCMPSGGDTATQSDLTLNRHTLLRKYSREAPVTHQGLIKMRGRM